MSHRIGTRASQNLQLLNNWNITSSRLFFSKILFCKKSASKLPLLVRCRLHRFSGIGPPASYISVRYRSIPVPDRVPSLRYRTGPVPHLLYFSFRYWTDRMPDSVAFRHLQNPYEGGTAYSPHLLTACGGKTSCRVHTAGGVKTPRMYVLLVMRDTLHVHIWLLVSLNLLCDVGKSYGNAKMSRKISPASLF